MLVPQLSPDATGFKGLNLKARAKLLSDLIPPIGLRTTKIERV